MDERKFEIIKKLMDELQSEMGHSPEDLGERLGRPKPDGVSIEIESVDPEMELEDEMEMGDEMAVGPEEKLKQRLLKLRG